MKWPSGDVAKATIRQMSILEVRKLARTEGLHRVAPGLYLRVRGGSALWTVRYTVAGKTREPSLGPFDQLGLADAVARAAELRARAKRGETITTERARAKPTARADRFRDVAEQLWESMKPGWKNAKHADQWLNTLKTYAYPKIGDKPVADVDTQDVLDVLNGDVGDASDGHGPLWASKHETATRVRQRIEAVLSAAKARGLRSGENPAAWKDNLDQLLRSIPKARRVEHHAAMPWAELPAFMAELRTRESVSSWALQFTILTACRTGEVIGALWPEFDLDAGLWIIPATRMKALREHRVPLSAAAIALLRSLPRADGSNIVFWSGRQQRARAPTAVNAVRSISNMAMLELLRGLRAGLTVHGFRSSFRDWAADVTAFPAEVVEMALSHTIQNQVEAAYRRGDLLGKRRELMDAWAEHLALPQICL